MSLRELIAERVAHIVAESPENTLHGFDEPSWQSPLIGIADGKDPLFAQFKEMIGEFYWTPEQVLKLRYPDETFDDISVAVWVLPQTENTLKDQRNATDLPCDRWIHSRHYGEIFNEFLRKSMEDFFDTHGIKSAAAAIRQEFKYQKSAKYGISSNWSERHTAYAAGMGTFGLSDGFITERGKAVRIGSIVINAKITPDIRKAENHLANCLFYAKGTCGACIKRCPIDAISKNGHDKQVCHDYIRSVTAPHSEKVLGAWQTPCGLCQAKIPCEHKNPMSPISK